MPIPPKLGVAESCHRSGEGTATKRRVAGERSSAQITAAVAGRATIATAVLTTAEGSGTPLARCEDATRSGCRTLHFLDWCHGRLRRPRALPGVVREPLPARLPREVPRLRA